MNRLWVVVLSAALLGGCGNRLTTDKAVLGPADAAGPQLRPGLWRIEDAGGSLRETNKTADWPDCGRWVLVRERDLATMTKEANGPVWTSKPYVLGGPDAQAMQTRGGDQSDDFELFGVRGLAFGPDGRATRIRRWSISCGPVRTTGAKDKDGRPETEIRPWPGVVMDGDSHCHPDGASGLMAAAAASETGEKSPDEVLHWVRSGVEPGVETASLGPE